MHILQWLKNMLTGQPDHSRPADHIPEFIGRVTDEQGRRWVFRRGRRKHRSLSADQLRRVARLKEVLYEANPITMQAWIDGFLRDRDPEREIRILEAITVVYTQLTKEIDLSVKDKQRLYDVLCLISMGVRTPDLTTLISAHKELPESAVLVEMVQQACSAGIKP